MAGERRMQSLEMGEKMPLAKRFGQAFLKLDTWFESTRGRSAEKREEKEMRDERTLFLWERKPVLKESSFGKAFLPKKRFVFDQTFLKFESEKI